MIINKNGDLLKSDCTVIMHQANCFATMGAGIAKSIAKLYPEAAIADKGYLGDPEEKLGKYSLAIIDDVTVVNLYGQFHYNAKTKQTNYGMLESAINKFFLFAKSNDKIDLSKVGVPYKMGAGLAGGDWKIISKILERQSKLHDIDIYIYKI